MPKVMHQAMAAAFDQAFAQIRKIQDTPGWRFLGSPFLADDRASAVPKGWKSAKTVDGLQTEGILAIASGANERYEQAWTSAPA